MKDINDKSDELKKQGREILSVRKELNVLRQENSRLTHALKTEEAIESEIAKRMRGQAEKDPVSQMPVSELKSRLLKLA